MFDFFLNHSREAFAKGELVFTSELPLWVLFVTLMILALIITACLVYRRQALKLSQLLIVCTLQLAMAGLLLVVLWQPALRIDQLRSGDNIIALMLDTSGSMSYGAENNTRLQQAHAMLTTSKAVTALGNKYHLQRYTFADDIRAVDSYDGVETEGSGTNLGESILQVLRLSRTTSLGAIIIASDGSDNSGRLDRERLNEIAAFGIPVHTIGMGREYLPEDLELEEVILPDKALPGTSLSASVAIRHDGKGMTRIKIHDGEKFLAAREVSLPAGASVTTALIDFTVPDKGHHDLSFTLEPLAGEPDIRNNTRAHVLEVSADSYRMLYVEGEPRWEYKFIRRALEDDPSVSLVTLLRVSNNKYYRQGIEDREELADGFPVDKQMLYGFDALILGSIEAPVFSPEQQELIRDFVSVRGGSLLMLAGPNGLGDGGWGNSQINEVLPSRLPTSSGGFRRDRAKVVLTAMGRNTPMLKLADDKAENLRLWGELPEIADYQFIGELRPAAVSLLNMKADQRELPLLATQPYGRGRSFILATGGTWRWQMGLPFEDQRHETFWRQLIRGLVTNTPRHFELSARKAHDRISIQAQLYDKQFEPAGDLAVTAVVSPEAGEPLTVELYPQPDRPGVLTGEFIPVTSGLYSIEAISRRNDKPLDTARIVLRHDAGNAESFALRQDRTTLAGIAGLTGGRYWTPDRINEIPEAIRHSSAGITEQLLLPLWNAPAFFLLLLMLKSLEWLLRRRWKTI